MMTKMNNIYKVICLIIIAANLCSCGTIKKSREAKFEKTDFRELSGWEKDKHSVALQTFINSCEKFLALDAEKSVSNATSIGGSAIDWQVPCMEAIHKIKLTDLEAKKFFERWFTPYKIHDDTGASHGTLTGYYQIELEGSNKKNDKFQYPIYKRPDNLDQMKGSEEIQHSTINKGALSDQGLEIVYVDNRARLYFMHIQGSGVIKLKEGGEMHLGFHDHNGYSFQGIHQELKSKDLQFNSAVEMMNWLHKNKIEGLKIIETDPSYVFFRKLDSKQPIGGQGVPLRPERSIAVDYGIYPYGVPIWVEAELSHTKAFSSRKYNRLFIAQDTGGAIRGPIRGDIFFGRGKKAEQVAGSFKSKGKFYILFPKSVVIPESYKAG